MRCKKHPFDVSSSVGVCASCLRERLFTLLAAQDEAQVLAQAQAQGDRQWKSDTQPPPLLFPRSVSPYISRRKSGNSAWAPNQLCQPQQHHSFPNHRLFGTPQVGPSGGILVVGSLKKKDSRFSLLSRLFGSKSDGLDSQHKVWDSSDSGTTSSSSPSSWFLNMLSSPRKTQLRMCSVGQSTAGGNRRACRYSDRGMSPVGHSDGEEELQCHIGSSGYSSESSQGWKHTPMRAPSNVRHGVGRTTHGRNISGLAFCLSPLVRASPRWQWKQKRIATEIGLSGEIKVQTKCQRTNAASFCKNGSRKLADFGRFSLNR